MRDVVFVDSGAFIAFLVRSDRLHREVVGLFRSPPAEWCTSVLVVAETHGWLLHRVGEQGSRLFLELLEELPALEVLDPDSAHRQETRRKLDAPRGLKLTYVDASSLVWLERRRIRRVWGTDHHLGVEGASVDPGAPRP